MRGATAKTDSDSAEEKRRNSDGHLGGRSGSDDDAARLSPVRKLSQEVAVMWGFLEDSTSATRVGWHTRAGSSSGGEFDQIGANALAFRQAREQEMLRQKGELEGGAGGEQEETRMLPTLRQKQQQKLQQQHQQYQKQQQEQQQKHREQEQQQQKQQKLAQKLQQEQQQKHRQQQQQQQKHNQQQKHRNQQQQPAAQAVAGNNEKHELPLSAAMARRSKLVATQRETPTPEKPATAEHGSSSRPMKDERSSRETHKGTASSEPTAIYSPVPHVHTAPSGPRMISSRTGGPSSPPLCASPFFSSAVTGAGSKGKVDGGGGGPWSGSGGFGKTGGELSPPPPLAPHAWVAASRGVVDDTPPMWKPRRSIMAGSHASPRHRPGGKDWPPPPYNTPPSSPPFGGFPSSATEPAAERAAHKNGRGNTPPAANGLPAPNSGLAHDRRRNGGHGSADRKAGSSPEVKPKSVGSSNVRRGLGIGEAEAAAVASAMAAAAIEAAAQPLPVQNAPRLTVEPPADLVDTHPTRQRQQKPMTTAQLQRQLQLVRKSHKTPMSLPPTDDTGDSPEPDHVGGMVPASNASDMGHAGPTLTRGGGSGDGGGNDGSGGKRGSAKHTASSLASAQPGAALPDATSHPSSQTKESKKAASDIDFSDGGGSVRQPVQRLGQPLQRVSGGMTSVGHTPRRLRSMRSLWSGSDLDDDSEDEDEDWTDSEFLANEYDCVSDPSPIVAPTYSAKAPMKDSNGCRPSPTAKEVAAAATAAAAAASAAASSLSLVKGRERPQLGEDVPLSVAAGLAERLPGAQTSSGIGRSAAGADGGGGGGGGGGGAEKRRAVVTRTEIVRVSAATLAAAVAATTAAPSPTSTPFPAPAQRPQAAKETESEGAEGVAPSLPPMAVGAAVRKLAPEAIVGGGRSAPGVGNSQGSSAASEAGRGGNPAAAAAASSSSAAAAAAVIAAAAAAVAATVAATASTSTPNLVPAAGPPSEGSLPGAKRVNGVLVGPPKKSVACHDSKASGGSGGGGGDTAPAAALQSAAPFSASSGVFVAQAGRSRGRVAAMAATFTAGGKGAQVNEEDDEAAGGRRLAPKGAADNGVVIGVGGGSGGGSAPGGGVNCSTNREAVRAKASIEGLKFGNVRQKARAWGKALRS